MLDSLYNLFFVVTQQNQSKKVVKNKGILVNVQILLFLSSLFLLNQAREDG
jgi:hypothetical protein